MCLCVQAHLSTQSSLTLSYRQPEQVAKLRWEPEFSLWIIFYLENNNPSLSILCRHGVPMRHQWDVVDVTWWSQSWRDMVTVTWSSALSELSASRSQPPAGGQVTLRLIRTKNDRSESLDEKSIIFAVRDFIPHFLFAYYEHCKCVITALYCSCECGVVRHFTMNVNVTPSDCKVIRDLCWRWPLTASGDLRPGGLCQPSSSTALFSCCKTGLFSHENLLVILSNLKWMLREINRKIDASLCSQE